jgi:hypothetical protein
MIREWLFLYRHRKACRKLQRLTEQRRNSFEIQDYRKRREAMLRVTRES